MPEYAMIDQVNPFDLNNENAYQIWREEKLNNTPTDAAELIVEINDPTNLSNSEHQALLDRCRNNNMAIYISKTGSNPDKRIALQLAARFGLHTLDHNMGADDDGITALQVSSSEGRERYIPYSDKAIHWHTDGYYNTLDKQIHALCLHCVRAAAEGGENALLDHEIAYIRLRDQNPDYIRALMASNAMTIPANIIEGAVIRPPRSGPVFSLSSHHRLHMRYTERAHNIIWHNDELTQAAVGALEQLLHSDDPCIYRLTLQPGWGLISNNVLHDRSGFKDDPENPRLLYRLRFFEGIS